KIQTWSRHGVPPPDPRTLALRDREAAWPHSPAIGPGIALVLEAAFLPGIVATFTQKACNGATRLGNDGRRVAVGKVTGAHGGRFPQAARTTGKSGQGPHRPAGAEPGF